MGFLGYVYDPADFAIFVTLLLLEAALSFDNAAVLAAVTRKLPEGQRRKALLYGLGGAYVFRAAAILLVSVIFANPWLKIVGGVYLVYLMGRHLFASKPHDAPGVPGLAKRNLFGLSTFWSIVITVELLDIAFALDQVTVAVALTPKVLLIILASFVAILFLRVSAFYVGKVMDWFPQLETLAYVAVGWVGIKLVLVTTTEEYLHWDGLAFLDNRLLGIGVTLGLIVLPAVLKLVWDLARRRPLKARSE